MCSDLNSGILWDSPVISEDTSVSLSLQIKRKDKITYFTKSFDPRESKSFKSLKLKRSLEIIKSHFIIQFEL